MMINLTRPFYLAPVHGEPRHQYLYGQIGQSMGYPESRIFTLTDGVPLEFTDKHAGFGEPVPAGRVLVDNSGTPGVTEEILRDRYNVSNEGLVTITVAVDTTHGEFVGDLMLQSKGVHGPDGLLDHAQNWVYDVLSDLNKAEISDLGKVRHLITDTARRAILKKSGLRPLIVVSIVEV